jgi:hypothetical protein
MIILSNVNPGGDDRQRGACMGWNCGKKKEEQAVKRCSTTGALTITGTEKRYL